MDVIKNWIKYVNYPLAMGITRNSERLHFYKNCIEKQYRPLKQNLEERDEALFDILDYAIKNVSYYQEIARKRNIHLSKENIKEGKLNTERQRIEFNIGDMTVSGEKEGPLMPSPKRMGILIMGVNPVAFDS